MLQCLFYVLVVSALLSAAGWLTEQGLRQLRLPTRGTWVATMVVTVVLAYLSLRPLIFLHAPSIPIWSNLQRIAPLRLPPITPPASPISPYATTLFFNSVISKSWLLLSLSMILVVTTGAAYVFWRRRAWPLHLLRAHCVGITPDVGPAVVGLLRPTIAIPRWVLDRGAAQQELIIAHEASHLEARDPLLLTSALIALILMPWNALLWWQWHRLRHAIEVDCDARVLSAGHDVQAYGEALIDVGQQRSRFLGTVAAMSETRTLLERRVEIMATRTRKPSIYAFAVLCALAVTVAVAATQITSPDSSANRQEITVDTATLDRYVGKYQLGPHYIMTVTRDGSQLNTQVTAGYVFPLFAETPDTFFWKISDVEVTFATDGGGVAGSATFHDHGHDHVAPRLDDAAAQAIEQWLAQRVSQQQPMPGSEAALRKQLAAVGAGSPDYDAMTPELQNLVRKQLPVLAAEFNDYGPVQSVEFKGVNDLGTDKYLVTHQSGKRSEWFIVLDADSKISYLRFRPAF